MKETETEIINRLRNEAQKELDDVSDLQVENENIQHDSVMTKKFISNIELMKSKINRIDEIVGELSKYCKVEPISSRDGTFTAYEKTVGMSGVDMERIRQTGLLDWFINNAREYLELNLVKIRDELGIDLSGYAVRPAYKIYTVSRDADFRYVCDLLSRYKEGKKDGEYEEE